MIDLAKAANSKLVAMLERHPRIQEVEMDAKTNGVVFHQGSWVRSVVAGNSQLELRGLVELMDNNPLVCADSISVPDSASTLALIALGPIALAGLITEPPTFVVNIDADEACLTSYLKTIGWTEGITIHAESQSGVSVAAATVIASIDTPQDWNEIDDLYEERFSRSFFVRRDEESPWDSSLVEGRPFAVYRLGYTPGDATSLLTIRVMADIHGKCGEAQIIHALNVMVGYEESLGID
ncbi:MAG: hypothetical protein BGO01_14230 [Armatimonadetes bacterium 55-13]|nr:MAG: hypothetical protein BGO01_14230 [Armatimonadetes bacterium 55-13]